MKMETQRRYLTILSAVCVILIGYVIFVRVSTLVGWLPWLVGVCLIFLSICIVLFNWQILIHARAEKKLFQQAYYDSLTELPNRDLLLKDLDQVIVNARDREQSVTVFYLDIDNFKNINDSLSYDVGDSLLHLFAKRLENIVTGEKIISRFSGDEFAIIVPNVDHIHDMTEVTRELLTRIAQPFVVQNHTIFITASIGISIYPYNGNDARTLMKNADIAMYRAKELGKNNYQFCTHEMTLAVEERARLDYHLHEAVLKNEFVLLYQPKLTLVDEMPVGVEVLIRWQRPNGELVYPVNFIALAESNGLIVPIGEWMLRTACLQGIEWSKAGSMIKNIAINISTRQFIESNFVESVTKILQETGFDPCLLEFEITESILMENTVNNLEALTALKNMGIKITIDDFGTGYSSLNYLRHFPLDKLKIDQSFVKEITSLNHDSSIINAILMMAHSLGLRVVAEGVETAIQRDFLKKFACDEAQGFYYSQPLPSDAVQNYFQKQHMNK